LPGWRPRLGGRGPPCTNRPSVRPRKGSAGENGRKKPRGPNNPELKKNSGLRFSDFCFQGLGVRPVPPFPSGESKPGEPFVPFGAPGCPANPDAPPFWRSSPPHVRRPEHCRVARSQFFPKLLILPILFSPERPNKNRKGARHGGGDQKTKLFFFSSPKRGRPGKNGRGFQKPPLRPAFGALKNKQGLRPDV